ncbi:MAG TPA: hypothetical protein VFI31_24090 [Pirellulales bacterium]|nr:hypothetical protein [Pirellulales bacterium]
MTTLYQSRNRVAASAAARPDELDNDCLDEWFTKQGYSTPDLEYDMVYVNGDDNLRRPNETWKVRLIEGEFQRLMFDVEDV